VSGSKHQKLRFIAPDFMFIDIYKSFIDISNCWRWEKDFKRMSLMLEHCKPFTECSLQNSKVQISKVTPTVPSGYTITGIVAVNHYRNIVGNTVNKCNCIELYGSIKDITAFGECKSVVYYKPFLNCLPMSVKLVLNNGISIWDI
jgi:hypothetical protein